MHFEGEFRVPGAPSEVIRRFADVPRMASCMPGAVLEPQAEDGSWPGRMIVAFGPKKVAFKGKVNCAFDEDSLTGTLHGRGTADMRAARIGVKVAFTLLPDPAAAAPTTIVRIVSDAELGGVLADFARTGGVAVANVIMADFARRASAEFAKDAPTAPPAALAHDSLPDARAAVALDPPGTAAFRSAPVQPSPFQASGARTPAMAARSEPAALSAHRLLWAVIKLQFIRLAQRLGLRARDA